MRRSTLSPILPVTPAQAAARFIIPGGNVGIGNTLPGYKLDVTGDINFTGTLRQNGTQYGGATTVVAGNVAAGAFGSNTGGGVYTFPGNVGIGTTAPGAALSVTSAAGKVLQLVSRDNTTGGVNQIEWTANNGTVLADMWSTGSSASPLRIKSASTIQFHTNNVAYDGSAPQMTIDASGSVGIGTASPSVKLDVRGSAGDLAYIWTGSHGADIGYDSGNGMAYYGTTDSNTKVALGTNGDGHPLVVDTSGNVGIGKTNPGTALDVNGTVTATQFVGGGAGITGITATSLSNFTVRTDRSDGNDYSLAGRGSGIYAITGSGTNGPGYPYLDLIHVTNSTDVAFQIAGGYNSDAMYFRGTTALQNGTGYSPWRTVIHSGNIGSYASIATNVSPLTGSYGSVNISGTTNSYSGIYFPDQGQYLMVDGDGATGFYNGNWLFYTNTSGDWYSSSYGWLSSRFAAKSDVGHNHSGESLQASNYYYGPNNAYGTIGSSIYMDTINTGSNGDPLEINYFRSGDLRMYNGDWTQQYGHYIYPGSNSGLGDFQKNYYISSNNSWGLYTNTSFDIQGVYDQGNRVYSATNPVVVSGSNFGGIYFYTEAVNPYTGGYSCPSGFTDINLGGSLANVHWCYR